jgi:nickel/cobalt exporter
MISLLHAVILNHWLPVLAIGRKEGWSLAQTIRITFIAGMVRIISTVIIGFLLGVIGGELPAHIEDFAPWLVFLLKAKTSYNLRRYGSTNQTFLDN